MPSSPAFRSTSQSTPEAPAPANGALGVYIHVPFCAHVCPYCDFNTYAGQERLIPRYVDAVIREIEGFSSDVAGRGVASIFLGGGTPSLLQPVEVERIIVGCRDMFEVSADAEVSIEVNPNGVNAAYFDGILHAGVTRISIGAQTFAHRGLRALGRLHDVADVGNAVRAARSAGVTNLSLDLIFGWPGQRLDDWERDLSVVLAGEIGGTVPDHLSLYSLIVEPGTPLADAVQRGIVSVPNDDQAADLYELAIDSLAVAGWTHYEIANWTRSPDAWSRHNALYWRNADCLGIGAGAHGTLAARRWMNHLAPLAYVASLESGRSAVSNEETIPESVARGETMMLGLRLLECGVAGASFAMRHGTTLDACFGETIADLVGKGLLDRSADRVRLTRRGLMLANDVCAQFLA